MIPNDGACWRQIRHGWFLRFSQGQSPPNMKFHNSLDFYTFWVAKPCQEGKGKKASLRNDQLCVKLSHWLRTTCGICFRSFVGMKGRSGDGNTESSSHGPQGIWRSARMEAKLKFENLSQGALVEVQITHETLDFQPFSHCTRGW